VENAIFFCENGTWRWHGDYGIRWTLVAIPRLIYSLSLFTLNYAVIVYCDELRVLAYELRMFGVKSMQDPSCMYGEGWTVCDSHWSTE
jgi:hypothetical protein